MKVSYPLATRTFLSIIILAILPSIALASNPNQSVEQAVREGFKTEPILIEIAKCETHFRQFSSDGSTLYGGYKGHMIGLMQFSEYYHRKGAMKLGYDIMTLKGNMDYAKYVHSNEGTRPWRASEHCWGKSKVAQGNVSEQERGAGKITKPLIFGMVHPQVKLLQKVLNEQGFTVASSGGGSPGSETSYFGSQTRKAVQAMQCKHKIVCEGSESTNGYGFVGQQTRPLINSFIKIRGAKEQKNQTKPKESSKKKEEIKEKDQKEDKEIQALQAQIKELLKQIEALQKNIKK